MGQPAEEALVDLIYAAAVDPTLWEKVLEAVADAIGAGNGVMTRLNHATALGDSIPFRLDEAALTAYAQYFHTRNVFTPLDDLGAWRRGWRPKVVATNDVLPVEDYYRTEYFNDFMRLQDAGATLHIRLELDDAASSAIAFGRPLHRGDFERGGFELATRLQPHLIRAFKQGRAMALAMGPDRDLARAVHQSAQAIFLVDGAAAIRGINAAGDRLLARGLGLTSVGGKLATQSAEAARQLDQLLAAAAATNSSATGGSMSIPHPGRRFPLALRVIPAPRPSAAIVGYPRTVVVCVTDLETEVRSPEDELRLLFGLTVAEARVATAIFEGMSMREAAEALGVALNTVRFQLAQVFNKIGVNRQADLVKLMMRLSSRQDGS